MLALLVLTAPAQELVWRTTGIAGSRQVGGQTIGIGDLNRDGHEDLVTIVNGHCGVGNGYYGYLWLLSGSDGTLIREVAAATSANQFDAVTPAGDMNADAVPDYAVIHVGLQLAAPVVSEVRSGADDSVLWSVNGPARRLLSDLDVNGDGRKDLVIGQFGTSAGSEVRVYSHGGQLLYRLVGGNLSGNPPLGGIGFSLAKVGDVDDDGCDDFVMGCGEPTARGVSVIVSGNSGQYLRFCYGDLPNDGYPFSMAAAGDLDDDGYADFVVGNGGSPAVPRGVMRAFSSRTGQLLHQWTGAAGLNYSFTVSGRGVDLDGDAIPDIVTGAGMEPVSPQQGGVVYAYSGRDGSRLHRFISTPLGPGAFGRIGYWTTNLRPAPGQHTGWIVVPDAEALPWGMVGCAHELGTISAYRGTPRTAQVLGSACAGNLLSPPDIGMQSLDANGVRVHLSRAPEDVPAVLLLGLSTTQFLGVPLPASLVACGWPGCSLRTSIEATFLSITSTGQNGGYVSVDLPHPIPATGNGIWSLSAQWLVLGDAATFPGGLTQAITWRR